ncbi:MAG: RIP metalloprotease RseP [Pseudomonadales bacterium]
MELLQYLLALIVTLGVLVTVHEAGHFIVARLSGVRVVRFSVGFGRPIWSRTDRRGTEFAIAAIPLGGYVRMLDEREPGEIDFVSRPDDLSYTQLSPWWRIGIALAGPFANFVLAFAVYWLLFVVGTTAVVPMLGAAPVGSPLAAADVRPGTEIVAVDGVQTPTWQQISLALAGRLGDTGDIVLTTRSPGAGAEQTVRLPIADWHRGEDEPDLFGSLGLVPALPAVFGEVIEGSVAERAGLRRWDRVVSVDGEAVTSWGQWVELVQAAPGRALKVTIERDGQPLEFSITPAVRALEGGGEAGFLGVSPYLREVRFGPIDAISHGLAETWDKTALTLGLLKKTVTGDVSVKNLSGPITIARVAGDSARSGWSYYLGILALLSISLGVLNLLPIPILDGGHVVFCVAELVKGGPVSERTQAVGTQIGLFLVAGMMLLAIFNDITRLF